MSEKLIIGPITKGLKSNVKPFNIDNDSFPVLINAYQWRGQIKRKRGTTFLTRLRRTLPELSLGVTGASPWSFNLFDDVIPPIITENGSIVQGSVTIHIATVPEIELVDNGDGTLSGFKVGVITNATQTNPAEITSAGHTLSTGDVVTINGVVGMIELNGNTYTITVTGANTFTLDGVDATGFTAYISDGSWRSPSAANFGTINYITGAVVITHTAGPGIATTVCFSYYPTLPVMGFRDLQVNSSQFPGNLAFDTTYSYNVLDAFPYTAYDVSYYKNPATDATNLPGYIPKTSWTPVTWNGENYQQFYTVNYQGALWASNGIQVPFEITKIGMQFKFITGITIITAGNGITIPAVADITIVAHGLVQGDFIYINEVEGITGINFQAGYVTSADPQAANLVRVTFPFAVLGGVYTTGGIAQYLTNRSDATIDCIRWYDGDPTDGALSCLGFTQGKGWVNFMPPLSRDNFSIADLPADQYYLVGAKVIAVYKDRLLFLGPVVQSSSGNPIYLQDTVVFSQNGTPYYTSSFPYKTAAPSDPTLAGIDFHPILLPINQTATAPAWFEDQIGFGGFVSAGLDEPIFTVGSNEDALIVGFDSIQTKFVETGSIPPFLFYIINSELGSGSTFSVIQMDQGVITRGDRGITITAQTQSQRIDLEVPDEVFEMKLIDNGSERVCSARDFINEWAFFTYPAANIKHVFPTQSLFYNYRDNSWAIFRECFTCYGQFNRITGFIWATVGFTYPTWEDWNDPWNAGESTLLQPEVVGGNQQGFLLAKDEGTGEGTSLYIESFSGSTVVSPDHCLNEGDFIIITGVLGTIGEEVNNRTFSIDEVTSSQFVLNPTIVGSGTHLGGGLIIRLAIPQIQTKEFPSFWGMGRKTRIGVQQYLLDTTANGQITLQIYLSQNQSNPYNIGPIVPEPFPDNNALVYSTVLYTCPESTNLGLTPYTSNLQMPTAQQQAQIWHRINTSLIGDTIQVGFTLSDAQMRMLIPATTAFPITGITLGTQTILDSTAQHGANQLIKISGVLGTTELNGNIYNVLSSTLTTVTIEVDSSAFTPYISGGATVIMYNPNQTEEIIIHTMILDTSPSMSLS